jgi:translation initiation factor IF-3
LAKNNRSKKGNRIYVNKDIRSNEVRCLNQDNDNIGVFSIEKAIRMAENEGLDLIQVSPPNGGIPTCRIADYGKYKFELSKKNKELARKQRKSAIKQKEIKFRPNTDINDLQTKARMASKFISEGCRVRIIIRFRGREMAHKFIAENRFYEFISCMSVDVNILNEPRMDGRSMVALLAAQKKQPQLSKVEKAS